MPPWSNVRAFQPGLDTGSDGGNPGSRLARVDGRSNRQPRQVDTTLAGDLDQVKGVGGRADEHRRAEGLHPRQSGRGVLAAPGNREGAERAGSLEARPESDEQAEREREEDAVGRTDARAP